MNRKNNSLFEKFSETTTPPHQPGDNVGGLILVLRGVKEYGNIAIQVNFQILADGLQVSIIDLSYVKSALLAGGGTSSMPFVIDADEAARVIVKGLARNKARITFPWQVHLLARIAINLPGFLVDRLNKPWGVPRLEDK